MDAKLSDQALPEQAERLRAARELRGFSDAHAAATFFGWNYSTYSQHERGERGLTRAAARYAVAFRVSESWLLTGEGVRDSTRVPIFGRIGAGSLVSIDDDETELTAGDWADLPDAAKCWALVVQGDSMRPRFFPGEVVLFSRQASNLADLVSQYCMVQIASTGERFVKILRKGRSENRWRLESHNADPMEDVELLAAFAWESTQRPRNGTRTLVEEARSTRAKRRR
jgi:transcriptional regulator with XRE-family HTH domain